MESEKETATSADFSDSSSRRRTKLLREDEVRQDASELRDMGLNASEELEESEPPRVPTSELSC